MFQYDYNIFPDNNPEKFKETCQEIQSKYPQAVKKDLLVDVDGSTIQVFVIDGKEIAVYDDYDIGAVFVKSEIELRRAADLAKGIKEVIPGL